MLKTYKYPVYPDEEGKEYLAKSAGSCRYVYNHFCDIQRKRLESTERDVLSYHDMCKELTVLKQKIAWLYDTPSHALQQALRQLDLATTVVLKDKIHRENLAKEGKNEPNTKPKELNFRKKGFNDSFMLPSTGESNHDWRITKHHVYPAKFKKGIRYDKYRIFVGKPRTCCFKLEIDQWYVIITCERKDMEVEKKIDKDKVIGIDVGVKRFATLSNAMVISPKDYAEEYGKLLRSQRELERRTRRKKNGEMEETQSKNREKTKLKVKKQHRRIANMRRDFVHKQSTMPARDYDACIVEDINISSMVRSARGTLEKPGKNVKAKSALNKSILNQGWGFFLRFLESKMKSGGKRFVRVDPKHTSQICSKCGYQDKENRKSQSKFECLECGNEMNADYNASLNIRQRGLDLI
jgi:putative transposase